MSDEHAGHRQRMRQRFREHGLKGFAPHEVLELILFHAIPRRNVNPLAHRLLEHFGSLHAVLDAPLEALEAVEGMGENAATLLRLFSDVARMSALSRQHEEKERASLTFGDLKRHCLSLLDGLKEEHFYVVCLDAKGRLIRDVLISKGSLSEAPAYPRQVAQTVLAHNAYAVVLCHNHPGGDEVPSDTDLTMTNELGAMLKAMEVTLYDHMIVADGRVLSMERCGLLTREKPEQEHSRAASGAGRTRIRHQIRKSAQKEET